ncbi:MAG: hypothetical protein HY303_03330, partial [Candidatus Wallbacteria bacterium]|nr:hypothetical protein [Candidatus Wallbacteria bacterium]
MPNGLRPLLRVHLLWVLALALLQAAAWCQTSPQGLAAGLPAEADVALYADVDGLVHCLNPEVVQSVVDKQLGQFLQAGLPDPIHTVKHVAAAGFIRTPSAAQAVALVQGDLDPATLSVQLADRLPGRPSPRAWNFRGLALTSLEPSGRPAVTFGKLQDGTTIVAQAPCQETGLLSAAIASLADTSKGYIAQHPDALPAGALAAFHLGNPSALSALPKLSKIPVDNLRQVRLEVRRLDGAKLRLDISVELTSWLKAQIVRPFLGTAVAKVAANPKLPEAARRLVGRLAFTLEGKVLKASIEATAEEIEQLL